LSAAAAGSSVTISGKLSSTPNSVFSIEFFSSIDCNTNRSRQGQNFLGSAKVMTDQNCNASFQVNLPYVASGGSFITATATDAAGNTSEYSECLRAIIQPVILNAAIEGKNLLVTGMNFDNGAVLTLNGVDQRTIPDPQNPSTSLIGKKTGKRIPSGTPVNLQVRNSDGTLSPVFPFMRPPG
jgi:hypothetical protein